MDYRLDGASQNGVRDWNWFSGKTDVKIEHGDVLYLIDRENYQFYEEFPKIRKIIMNMLGYRFCYSTGQKRYVIVHKSILERYFTKLT